MLENFEPDFAKATVVASPNHGERVDVSAPDMIILRYTGMDTEEGALSGCAIRTHRSRAITLFGKTAMSYSLSLRRAAHGMQERAIGAELRILIPAP